MQEYRFSLTGASLMVEEFVGIANNLVHANFKYDEIGGRSIDRERETTRRREFKELSLRLSTLSKDEIEFLCNTNVENQKLMAFIACVRLYRILREFIEEVVLNKLQVFDYEMSTMDFNNFLYNKSVDSEDIHSLSESTKKKVQQVIFKLFEQAGLIDDVRTKKLQIPFLDHGLQTTIPVSDHKYLLNI